ncbi:GIY-YIG nuclease family protein [Tropicimonas marinistellae]|uniref:GIY-YIG nuclease family protein n=1 Tax=Tropicimonas marinistellae TaxID=1739787 RepID=UPI0008302683|nr:GIY-YIG nuclease family protein [Tropicimonas marinistellae]
MLAERTRHWRSVRVPGATPSRIPALPGVYVIADVLEVASLRLRVEPIYVGKTYSLRRRIGEHLDPWRTHNASLSRRLTAGPKNSKFELWFQVLERNEISKAEKELIKALQPEANIIRYGENNDL